MDFELEMAFFVGGPPNAMGTPLSMKDVDDRLFGLVLMNDWSARDIQKWEYVPLGPFLAKNFATSISAWVVTFAALAPFVTAAIPQDPVPLPYLRDPAHHSYDINLSVAIQADGQSAPHVITNSNSRYLYWSARQQLVHHAITGCNMMPGDLCGSGTISGPGRGERAPDKTKAGEYGSLLELTWRGKYDIDVGGQTRKFLRDGDTVVMTGFAQGHGYRVGFGDVRGTILPAPAIP